MKWKIGMAITATLLVLCLAGTLYDWSQIAAAAPGMERQYYVISTVANGVIAAACAVVLHVLTRQRHRGLGGRSEA